MFQLFLFCAVIGSTVLLLQLGLSLLGLGGDEFEFGDEVWAGDGGDMDLDGGHVPAGLPAADADSGPVGSSTSAFGRLSLRSVVAAIAFFGFGGMASLQSGIAPVPALLIGAAVGLAALFAVTEVMKFLYGLHHDGTVRVDEALGHGGTVYLPVPAERQGSGKVQIHMDDRVMEFEAVTPGSKRLITGAKIVVTEVLGPRLLEVAPDDTQAWPAGARKGGVT